TRILDSDSSTRPLPRSLLSPSSLPHPLFPLLFLPHATATTEIYTLSLHDALPILACWSPSVVNSISEANSPSLPRALVRSLLWVSTAVTRSASIPRRRRPSAMVSAWDSSYSGSWRSSVHPSGDNSKDKERESTLRSFHGPRPCHAQRACGAVRGVGSQQKNCAWSPAGERASVPTFGRAG